MHIAKIDEQVFHVGRLGLSLQSVHVEVHVDVSKPHGVTLRNDNQSAADSFALKDILALLHGRHDSSQSSGDWS